MGRDKALVEIDGIPLWRRQLAILQNLAPAELMIAGPSDAEWSDSGCVIVPDLRDNAGPLAGIAAALRCCSTPLLLVLAVDLPNITSAYLRGLVLASSADIGVVPKNGEYFEPVAAVYPARASSLAENSLAAQRWSLQALARDCIAARFVSDVPVSPNEQRLFLNLNTPEDLARVATEHHVA